MLKKIRCLIILIFAVLILVSCNDKQKELDEKAYSYATIETFLTKDKNTHLRANLYPAIYIDEDDEIYNMLVNTKYEEQSNVANLGSRCPISLDYAIGRIDMYFYEDPSIIGIHYLIDAHITTGIAERYYKIDSDAFNEIYSKIELCISNVESN